MARDGAPPRVLIAEDEPNIAEALCFVLERAGYEVELAPDGEAALERLSERPPHVLVLDVMMPRESGFKVLQRVRADSRLRSLPVMVLTARGQTRDRQTAEDAGADAFLTKPFSNQAVVDEVRRLAGR